MAQVVITINYREYPISCEDGGELQIMKLGRILDDKAHSLTQALGQINENQLLAMVGLLIADELSETKKELANSTGRAEDLQKISELETAINNANQQIELLNEAKSVAENNSSALENEVTEASQKITELERKLLEKEQQINNLTAENKEARQKTSDAETTALETMNELTDLEKKLAAQEQQIKDLTQSVATAEEKLLKTENILSAKEAEIETYHLKIKELEEAAVISAKENETNVNAEELTLIDEELALEISSLSDQIKSVALKLKSI